MGSERCEIRSEKAGDQSRELLAGPAQDEAPGLGVLSC